MNKKIFCLLLVLIITCINLKYNFVYASSEAEELKEMLNEYENDLGNLQQFKEVMDGIYNDLNTVKEVDDVFKEKLKNDIGKLNNVDGMNPVLKSILDIELKSQADKLDNENIYEMKEEILAMKEWVDDKLKDDTINKSENIKPDITHNAQIDQSLSNQPLPKAGIKSIINISLILIVVFSIVWIIKYLQLKEIK